MTAFPSARAFIAEATTVPPHFEAFVQGIVRRRNETHVIWFDSECREWATLPGHDHNARWDLAVLVVEPHNAWHRRAS